MIFEQCFDADFETECDRFNSEKDPSALLTLTDLQKTSQTKENTLLDKLDMSEKEEAGLLDSLIKDQKIISKEQAENVRLKQLSVILEVGSKEGTMLSRVQDSSNTNRNSSL